MTDNGQNITQGDKKDMQGATNTWDNIDDNILRQPVSLTDSSYGGKTLQGNQTIKNRRSLPIPKKWLALIFFLTLITLDLFFNYGKVSTEIVLLLSGGEHLK